MKKTSTTKNNKTSSLKLSKQDNNTPKQVDSELSNQNLKEILNAAMSEPKEETINKILSFANTSNKKKVKK